MTRRLLVDDEITCSTFYKYHISTSLRVYVTFPLVVRNWLTGNYRNLQLTKSTLGYQISERTKFPLLALIFFTTPHQGCKKMSTSLLAKE